MKEDAKIINEIITHTLQGVMLHHDIVNIMDFMGLKTCKKAHEQHEKDELHNLRCLEKYCITHLDSLPADEKFDRAKEIIPSSWYNASRFDVTESDRKSKVKDVFTKWHEWEKETKAFLERKYQQLMSMGAVATAEKVCDILEDVDHELKHLEQRYIQLSATGWSIESLL